MRVSWEDDSGATHSVGHHFFSHGSEAELGHPRAVAEALRNLALNIFDKLEFERKSKVDKLTPDLFPAAQPPEYRID